MTPFLKAAFDCADLGWRVVPLYPRSKRPRPDGWQNLERVFPDYRAAELLEAGLVVENEQGRRYDRFRDRILFPIADGRGWFDFISLGSRISDA